MKSAEIAILIFGDANSNRNALTEEKYKDLATAFSSNGFNVNSVLYHDDSIEKLKFELPEFDAVLVWVNPIEQGMNRMKLDSLLVEIADKGCFVSAHPEIILKMGAKDVLYKTREMDWGGDTKIYATYEEFAMFFHKSLQESKIRVLKQYRGNGGNGVYKIIYDSADAIRIIHATTGNEEKTYSLKDFNNEFKSFFSNNGKLIDQEWNENTVNGMVRCYLSGTKVAGFGYQEINALYELNNNATGTYFPPSKRYYFTEHCGMYNDLKELMENKWVPQLQEILSIKQNQLPVIWDADFFINDTNTSNIAGKYSLCEINVSCVSPFPPSAIKFIVKEVRNRIA
ncbi:MAG: Cj0069 family protein [Nitrososphaerales archaeon]